MACAVCEHCHSPVLPQDKFAIHEGFSYHKNCYKCYVCSETNLHNAEVFKGVIFCSSCAKRIFEGCASARKTKQQVNSRIKRSRSRSRSYAQQINQFPSARKTKQRDSSKRSRSKLRRKRERSRLQERRLDTNFHGVIERAQMGGSTSDSTREVKKSGIASKTPVITEMFQVEKNVSYTKPKTKLRNESAEIGVTTDVTQQLLEQINDFMQPVGKPSNPSPKTENVSPVTPPPRRVLPAIHRRRNRSPKPPKTKKPVYSDLRIAELGVSTEIANMALRKKSEVPVIIKSDHQITKDLVACSLSVLDQESEAPESMDSAYSTLSDSGKANCLDRRLRSILKIPYKFFKRNILTRSSLISLLMSSKQDQRSTIATKMKMLFHEEITEHRGRGMRKLYPTINRRKTPYKLGWMDFVASVSGSMNGRKCLTGTQKLQRCRHLESHSYRCMRAQVMRLAGPTASQLACFRKKLKGIALNKVVRNVAKFFVGPVGDTENKKVRDTHSYDIQTVFQADAAKPATPWKGMGKTYIHLYSMLN